MAATTVGPTTAKTIISDATTIGASTYGWYVVDTNGNGYEPRAPIAAINIAAQTNIMKKNFDLTAVYRISGEPISSWVDYLQLKKILDVWDAGDTLLYLNVQNEWSQNLAIRGTKAIPTTQALYQGKLINFRWVPKANEVIVSIEFHYTTA